MGLLWCHGRAGVRARACDRSNRLHHSIGADGGTKNKHGPIACDAVRDERNSVTAASS